MTETDAVPQIRFGAGASADVDALVALIESAYRGEESRAGWTTEAHLLSGQRTDAAAVEAAITDPGSLMLMAWEDEHLLACCRLQKRAGGVAYFGMFAVSPGRQSRGTGRALLARAERLAFEEWGAVVMEMTVIRQRHELIAWYERRGYERTGRTAPFPYGDERYGIPQRDDLEFVVLARPLGSGRESGG